MKLRTVFFGIAAFTGAGLLLLIAAWAVWLNVEKGKVRAIQEEMRAEGLPMTAADLEPPPLAEADNAAPLLERAAELLKELKKREGWVEALPGPGVKGGRNPAEFDAAKLQRFREQMDWPETQEVLRLLREAAAKPELRFERDLSKDKLVDLDPLSGVMSGTRLLAASAWLMALADRHEDSLSEFLAVASLARLLRQRPMLIDWLVAVWVDSVNLGAVSETLSFPVEAGGDGFEGIEHLLSGSKRDLHPSLARAFDAERVLFGGALMEQITEGRRFFGDLMIEGFSQSGNELSEHPGIRGGIERLAGWDRMILFAAQIYSHAWNPLIWADRAAYLDANRQLRHAASEASTQPSEQTLSVLPRTAFITRAAVPSLGAALDHCEEFAAQLQLGQLGLALERWRAQHGRHPDSLAELALPTEETTDSFSGQPFIYRLEGDGVRLYSVGKDGKDDGGTTKRRRDLVWRVQRGSVSSAE